MASVLSAFFAHFERSSFLYADSVFRASPEKGNIVKLSPLTFGSGVIISPKFSPRAIPPRMKNGASIPIFTAKDSSFLVVNSRFKISFNAFKTVAPLLEPPPKPLEIGMFFSTSISIFLCEFLQ